jgi:hypothetical protein
MTDLMESGFAESPDVSTEETLEHKYDTPFDDLTVVRGQAARILSQSMIARMPAKEHHHVRTSGRALCHNGDRVRRQLPRHTIRHAPKRTGVPAKWGNIGSTDAERCQHRGAVAFAVVRSCDNASARSVEIDHHRF